MCRKKSAQNLSLELHRTLGVKQKKHYMLKEEGIEPIKGFKKEGKLQSNARNLRFS